MPENGRMNIGSLCSGYGGLDMAVEYIFNAKTIWMSDIDKASTLVIEKRWNLPNLGNLKTINWDSVKRVDILTAGYPCQPFSQAGQRKGAKDDRHLWPDIKKIISILRPKFVVLENVRGHLSLGFAEVLADLTEIGYDAKWKIVRASDVGAPHRRERLFIIAYPDSQTREQPQRNIRQISKSSGEKFDGSNRYEYRNRPEIVGNADTEQLQTDRQAPRLGRRYQTPSQMQMLDTPNPLVSDKLNPLFVEYMMGLPAGWITNLDLSDAQKFKLLGNGVVPQQAELALNELCYDIQPIA